MYSHEIDYSIYGDDMQYVEIELDPMETVVAEAGALMMMTPSIQMETIFGDGSKQNTGGFVDKIFSAGKRVLTGESLFMTAFTNVGQLKEKLYFAAPYPGKILPMDLRAYGGQLICQKDAFLCAAKGVSIGIDFRKKLSVGFFGGEGFILEKLEGDGMAFIHACGAIVKRDLVLGEILKIDTGCLVAMTRNVQYDIQFVGGIKNTLFGGEGIFFATVSGPGTVWIQSLPFSRLAERVFAAAPGAGGRNKEEGSVLGMLGNFLDGDN
ncbi:TIGR00266 family protein [Clostridium sp.]|uniref:TIGR00266 family protein n=1 Tax=Clostridium sp. TaxID=1506 RepID=UPI00261BADFB|nr:TIGR00266 family protein [Clostridium sp.]